MSSKWFTYFAQRILVSKGKGKMWMCTNCFTKYFGVVSLFDKAFFFFFDNDFLFLWNCLEHCWHHEEKALQFLGSTEDWFWPRLWRVLQRDKWTSCMFYDSHKNLIYRWILMKTKISLSELPPNKYTNLKVSTVKMKKHSNVCPL